MKIKQVLPKKAVFAISTIFCVLFLTGCGKDSLWVVKFKTAQDAGICYYIDNKTISSSAGELYIQNRSQVPVHLFIFNDTKNGRLEYEADLDLGGILSYPNIDKSNRYTVALRVFDGKGSQDIVVVVYGNFDLVPYDFKNSGKI